MSRYAKLWASCILAACCGWSFVAAAEPPAIVNYQGVLRDSADRPLDGLYDMAFQFYSADTGGDFILQDLHANTFGSAVVVSNGLFNVALGTGIYATATVPVPISRLPRCSGTTERST